MGCKLELDALRMRLRHVEDNARGAGARIERDLQVAHVCIEGCSVEREAVALSLHPGFIVPQRLVTETLIASEDGAVGRRAQCRIERIIDATQPEPLRSLGVERHVVRRLVAGKETGVEAVRAGPVRLVVAVREQPARFEAADFLVIIVPATSRDREPVGKFEACFSEDRILLEIVGKVRIVRRIGREAIRHGSRRTSPQCGIRHRIVTGSRQPLAIETIGVGVKRADQPLKGAIACRAQPQFLGKRLDIRRIAQIRWQQDAGCRIAEINRYRSRQRAGIAADEDVAVRIGADRGERGRTEVDIDCTVGDEGLIAELFTQQQILLALAENHLGPGGRELVAEQVVNFLPVEPVGRDFLVDHAWRDRDVLRRLEGDREAPAIAVAIVHILAARRA
jgi:hypothetical protein